MKKMIAGAALAAFAISTQLALAHGTAPATPTGGQTPAPDCTAKEKEHNKLMGGLSHSTEKCASTASSGLAGSLPPDLSHDRMQNSAAAQSGVALTVTGADACTTDRKSGAVHAADFNRSAAGCSTSESASASTPLPADGGKIKTKSNIKNDRMASSSSSS